MRRFLTTCLLLVAGSLPVVGDLAYPAHPNVVDVTRPPYSAKGDGVSDDTIPIQRALNENVGRHRLIYFPRGTYLLSASLTWWPISVACCPTFRISFGIVATGSQP